MSGGLMQLVAYGAQDIYLTGNPLITYFKVVYRRHTNFAMESIAQVFNGAVEFGRTVTALISRNGDLISGMTLQADLPSGNTYCHNVGHYLIKEVSVEIGGQTIDKHYADWLDVWAQLTVPAGQMLGYRKMIGEGLIDEGGNVTGIQDTAPGSVTTVYVPLQFWFCRNVGLALPLIALQYHEVKVNMTFNARSLVASGANNGLNATLYVDYIYLDTDERRRFAQVSHEYLIEQLQTTDVQVASTTTVVGIDLNLNHPVKELIWVFKNSTSTNSGLDGGLEPCLCSLDESTVVHNDNITGPFYGIGELVSAKLQLNGQDRFQERKGGYFNLEQPKKHHTNVPVNSNVYVYSFALKPEEHQPSGTCNFSRIDNAKLTMVLASGRGAAGVIKVFATNYNVLRIMSGMGGLAYSN